MRSHLGLVAVALLGAALVAPTIASATTAPHSNAQTTPVETLIAQLRDPITNETALASSGGTAAALPPETAAQLAQLKFGFPYSAYATMHLKVTPTAPMQRDLWIAGP
ncbi:hypothetical protein EPN52_10705 [bacterium]|nr:MAG: hypothetical protein EPN52_10705 [bacterium]